MTATIPVRWHFNAITTAPKPSLSAVLFIVDLRPRGAMAVEGTVSCATGQYSKHSERLNSIHFFETKKSNFSIWHPEWLSKPAKWLQNSSLAFWRGSKYHPGWFHRILDKAVVLFFFPVSSGSAPLWLYIPVTNTMMIKTLETEILSN